MINKALLIDPSKLSGDISFLAIDEDHQTQKMRETVFRLPRSREVKPRDIVDNNEFVRKYSLFIHNLNLANASRDWWAMYFTNKNPIISPLCKKIYNFIAITRLVEDQKEGAVIVMIRDREVVLAVRQWVRARSIAVTARVREKITVASWLRTYLPHAFILYTWMRIVARSVASKRKFQYASEGKVDCIICTQFEDRSAGEDGIYDDVYFGRLSEFLKAAGRKFVTCNFVPYSFNGIYRLNPERQSHPVYPVEYFLSLKDAAVCLKELYAAYPKRQMVRGRAEIDGVDLSSLVKGEIDRSFNSGQVLMNKALYCGIRNAVRRLKPDSVLSTFENRSWEKMIISASRDANPRVKVTGYFHTSLTPQHLHMLFEDGEKESMPFPDRIIVAGGTVQTILEDVCRFPKGIISVGCALRQEKLYAPSGDPGPVPEDILVVLASSTDEYVRMLQFLDRAVIGDKYRIRIRPHPAISFTKALRIYTPGRLTYTLDSHKRSIDSVRDARCVLYASSTVSIEAIAMGTPVVYIDFGNFIDTDPLFTARSLKWTCREPNELQSVIEKISSIDAVVMGDGRQEARTFARGYFREVTVDTVRPFILAA